MLLRLNGLVLTGMISARAASLLERNLRTVLDSQTRRAAKQPQDRPQEGLAELCRRHPELVNDLEPFLTDEQIQRLLAEVRDQ
jgi:hypothetical protein